MTRDEFAIIKHTLRSGGMCLNKIEKGSSMRLKQ